MIYVGSAAAGFLGLTALLGARAVAQMYFNLNKQLFGRPPVSERTLAWGVRGAGVIALIICSTLLLIGLTQ